MKRAVLHVSHATCNFELLGFRSGPKPCLGQPELSAMKARHASGRKQASARPGPDASISQRSSRGGPSCNRGRLWHTRDRERPPGRGPPGSQWREPRCSGWGEASLGSVALRRRRSAPNPSLRERDVPGLTRWDAQPTFVDASLSTSAAAGRAARSQSSLPGRRRDGR
jgi:hypothetical protein